MNGADRTRSQATSAYPQLASSAFPLQNLQSRVYYDKPEDVRAYVLHQLLEIQEEREARAAQLRSLMEEGPSDSQSDSETPCQTEDNCGIFSNEDFVLYFRLLAGRGQKTIPCQRLCNGPFSHRTEEFSPTADKRYPF